MDRVYIWDGIHTASTATVMNTEKGKTAVVSVAFAVASMHVCGLAA